MTIKHINEERCKICKAVFPDESDLISDVWLLDKETKKLTPLGYFCEFCRPPSAEIVKGIYTVIKMG